MNQNALMNGYYINKEGGRKEGMNEGGVAPLSKSRGRHLAGGGTNKLG